MAAEQQTNRIETRLLRGLRMRTIRQRVLSLERIQRWSQCSLGKPWPTSNTEVEDYMHDLAAHPKRGTSSFARAKMAMVYAEAAADRPTEERLGESAALKLCIQELSLQTSARRKEPKREAKQFLTSMAGKLEHLVVSAQEMFIRAYAWLKLVTIGLSSVGKIRRGLWKTASS